ncbi:MAG: DUF1566 domain-containing protein [Sulfurimonas sp.]
MKTKIITALMATMVMSTIAMGTVIRVTNLEVVYDSDTKLLWQDNSDAKTIWEGWEKGTKYCKNLSIDKYNGWRLPSKEELIDLYRKKRILKNISSQSMSNYLSSTSSEGVKGISFAWDVSFSDGSANEGNKVFARPVRCVRAGELFDSLGIKIKETIAESELREEEEAKQEALKKQEQAKQEALKKQKGELEKQDKELYSKAYEMDTTEAYKEYLQKSPNGKYASAARDNISPESIAKREQERKHPCEKFYIGKNIINSIVKIKVDGVDKENGLVSFQSKFIYEDSWNLQEATCSALTTFARKYSDLQ